MIAEVLAIGDELTSGERLNTNSQWLSKRLGEIGIPVAYHSTVVDQMGPLRDVIETAVRRADVILVTGGLGPTADDLTREAIALALGVPLVLDEPSLAHIDKMFTRRGRPMPERNRIQAMFPEGTRVIPNPEGTAPGVDASFPRIDGSVSRLFALPGVPAEMFQMWEQTVRPALIVGRNVRTIRHREIKVFGAGESAVEQMLPDLIRRGRVPSVGITAHQATITLRITAEGDSEEECLALAEPTAKIIYDCLGSLVYGEGTDDVHHAVIRRLRELGRTLATVEIGTSGRLATAFAESNAGDVYRGG
ncbi:MAG TPA: molybdopterin-binding protein, partial [Pirellulales bacterium]